MKARLYGIPASHPVTAADLMLDHKGIEYSRVDLLPALHKVLVRALDRIDAWIAGGVLGGEQLNAADFQIAPSIRLLMSFADLAPAIEARPAGELAQRVQPSLPGQIGPVFPAEWLAPMRASVPV